MKVIYRICSCLLLILWVTTAQAQQRGQYYAYGAFAHGFARLDGLHQIVTDFNARENHNLAEITSLSGYQFGFGNYGQWSMVEVGFGNISRLQKSNMPNQLRENAEVGVNFMAANFNVGLKPFRNHYFVAGLGMQLGLMRGRYSFGADYQTPIQQWTFAPELFLDYGLKIGFLTRKEDRGEVFYLLRIRPYYQFHMMTDWQQMEAELNLNPNASGGEWEDQLSHFGFRIGLVIPFGSKKESK